MRLSHHCIPIAIGRPRIQRFIKLWRNSFVVIEQGFVTSLDQPCQGDGRYHDGTLGNGPPSHPRSTPGIGCCTLGQLFIPLFFVDKKHKFRTIIFYKNYFDEFFIKQRDKVKAKIIWTFDLIEELQRVPETYLKHLENTDGLFEIRVQQGSDIFRIFCFFDQGQLVVLANGFQKKTKKTPKKEIEKALKIKEEYENEEK